MSFTFYISIYAKFYIMMIYIFKNIYFIYEDDIIEDAIRKLFSELVKLGDKYGFFEV